MKISELKTKSIRTIGEIIAFKWLPPDDNELTKSGIYIPHDLSDSKGDRLGRLYSCEAIAIGPDCDCIKPGDKFMLHEYDMIDQSEKWDKETILFCKASVISLLLDSSIRPFSLEREITPGLEEAYMENNESVQAGIEKVDQNFNASDINPSIKYKYGR